MYSPARTCNPISTLVELLIGKEDGCCLSCSGGRFTRRVIEFCSVSRELSWTSTVVPFLPEWRRTIWLSARGASERSAGCLYKYSCEGDSSVTPTGLVRATVCCINGNAGSIGVCIQVALDLTTHQP